MDPGAHGAPVVRVWKGGRLKAVWSARWEPKCLTSFGVQSKRLLPYCTSMLTSCLLIRTTLIGIVRERTWEASSGRRPARSTAAPESPRLPRS